MSNHNKRKKIVKFEKAPELNQKTKDSLHTEANKYGKAFFSPKHKVNVDPEDGVLSNRPVYSDGSKLTYESIDKPHSESNLNMNSSPLDFDLVSGFQNVLGSGNANIVTALRNARRKKGRRGMSSGFQDQIMAKLDAIANSVGNNASNAAQAQPAQPAQPQMPGNPGPAPYDKDPIQDLAANMAPPAAAGADIQAAEDMFGTPLERQKSVSKKYCKKNK